MVDSTALRRVLDRLARLPRHAPDDADVRLVVQARAADACEYCLMPTNTQFHVDHIIPRARWSAYASGALFVPPEPEPAGPDHLVNFAWSCPFCNHGKGDQVSGRMGRRLYPLFNPRRQRWDEHFLLAEGYLLIVGTTEIGQATERALRFNDSRRNGPLGVRHRSILADQYPPSWARTWGI
jgi:5-methylcytosine-specific restriction endonuclease McrA